MVALTGTIATGAVAVMVARLNKQAADAAREVSKVKHDLAQNNADTGGKLDGLGVVADKVEHVIDQTTAIIGTKLDGQAKVIDAVHILVNSSMSLQLKISMVALKRVAELTKHPDDIAAAKLAEKSFHEHEAKQAIVDDKKQGA